MISQAEIGAKGEAIATKYLRRNGFMIRDLNWRNGRYEIDIIAERWGVVHFVEVKTRKKGGWSSPEDAITSAKFASLRKAASAYLASHAITGEHQFDLVAIDMDGDNPSDIRYVENAMQSAW